MVMPRTEGTPYGGGWQGGIPERTGAWGPE